MIAIPAMNLRQDQPGRRALGARRQRLYAVVRSLGSVLVPRTARRPGRQLLRVAGKRLWTRIDHHIKAARSRDDMGGIDETSVKKGHEYITVVHDLEAKPLLFACPGRDHATVATFAQDLTAHGCDPEAVAPVCMDMSAAYTKGVGKTLPKVAISFDRFHVVALANEAMDAVRREDMRTQPAADREALGSTDRKVLKGLMWGMRKNPVGWSSNQTDAMHWLQRSSLKSARAWRLKQALREVYARALAANSEEQASTALRAWLSWARRCRLAPFKRLANTLAERFDGGCAACSIAAAMRMSRR